ncbi:hypothetical protein QC762_0072540 [Podospora pseudocomata]|uniref:NACHT domain-containing protein n=1 Tax=Podospora pseudocomata TaxID=2093779 RepID=A0ABR0GH81_9PEZI|nr:hypothetical protein QC762_0072540 [Podospora pseudocomata]
MFDGGGGAIRPMVQRAQGTGREGWRFQSFERGNGRARVEVGSGREGGLKGKLTWKLNKKEMDGLMSRIERCKGVVSVALLGDHSKLLLAISTDLVCVKEGVDGIKERINNLKVDMPNVKDGVKDLTDSAASQRSDEQMQKTCDWLSPLDFASKHQDALRRLEPGTGEWFLSDATFKLWLDGNERVLWCPGIPGAGKTTLASLLISFLETSTSGTNSLILYLYCNYKERSQQSVQNMMGSLLKQLIQHTGVIDEDIVKSSKDEKPVRLETITRFLQNKVMGFSLVYIIVDALDECADTEDTQSRLASDLHNLPKHVKLLFTSRYTIGVEEDLGPVPRLEIRASDEDIKRYIEGRVGSEHSRLQKHIRTDPDLLEEIIDKVVGNCKGMFLMAQLHMNELTRKPTRRELRKALDVLPAKLDETYDQAMERIKSQDAGDASLAHQVLGWISTTLRPLAIEELQHALAVMPGDQDLDPEGLHDPELFVAICAGLVTLEEESGYVRLVHFTTQEYFERLRSQLFPDAPSMIATACLTYMTFDPFVQRYCADGEELDLRLDTYPFLAYAADYWREHVQYEMEAPVKELLWEFVDNILAFMTAEQAATLTGKMSGYSELGHSTE